ncbi:hypothetical protein SAMN05518672_10933 [Chitinophaga sp. CF118]|uniref:three component ABC system middle component n=1 Tax=Chitinophaga sp. CF118 TaxID=1884367 RepID=UPI0008E0F186|nr:three component ABC system middle component [Chitinophaga sp. CF118]SFE67415.1 hypothetical protein SAMN05518672_10933 [Chitinophaga sp. CF118]
MKQQNLFELLQNTVLGTIALHSFTLGFHMVAKDKNPDNPYPTLNYFFYVLPIVYNKKAMETVKGSRELYSVLLKDNSIILELQERANKMTTMTFDCLNMAFSKDLLYLNCDTKMIELGERFKSKRLPLPASLNNQDNSVKKIQECAVKLGAIFAKRDIKNIQFELNITL